MLLMFAHKLTYKTSDLDIEFAELSFIISQNGDMQVAKYIPVFISYLLIENCIVYHE